MSDQNPPTDDDRSGRIHEPSTSRRRFLEVAGAAGMVAGGGAIAYAGQQQQTTYELGAEVSGWQGQSPEAIAGQTNPTLELAAGTEYEVVWENLDGQPHDFVILDADGNELAGTEVYQEEGATASLTFTATEEMAEYVCTIHPASMVGDVEVTTGDQAGTPTEAGTPTAAGTPAAGFAGFVPEGPTVGVERVADGPLVNPVTLRSVPGEENAHLVVDQLGTIYVLQDGELREEPFLDISDSVLVLAETRGGFDRPPGFDERGLLGLDFHPNFEENGLFYVRYSSRNPVSQGQGLAGPDDRTYPEDWDHIAVLSEFQVAGDDAADGGGGTPTGTPDGETPTGTPADGTPTEDGAPLVADPDSERVLLEVPEPQFNHNGGEVTFGPDGYLYTSLGDGGDGNDTGVGHVDDWYEENDGGNAQNPVANLLGTVLRIDVDSEGENRPYAVPEDNPLVDTEAYGEIWAYGLRNPWRISFDGDQLIAADVGQALFEEVDVVERGGNYGWNVKEGFHCFNAANATQPLAECPDSEPDEAPFDGSELVDPQLEYPHVYQGEPVGISVTGGFVYRGADLGDLQGQYVFGDWSASFTEPRGRVFVATRGDEGEAGDGTATDGTPADDGTATEAGTPAETATETAADGTETAGEGVELTPPDEQPWQWSEVLIEGGQNRRLNRFVQSFGRDDQGNVYVLASRTGRLLEPNGEIWRIVPAGEGEAVEVPDVEPPTPTETGTPTGEAGTPTEDAGTPADGTGTPTDGA